MSLEAENERLKAENKELRELVKKLEARIAELEGEKKKKKPEFVKANKKRKGEQKGRRKRAGHHNKGRRREEPTRTESHHLTNCPDCGGELSRHKKRYSRQIIDIPEPQPVEVVEHEVLQGWCEKCREWHIPEVSWAKAIGQGRIGVRLMGLVGYLRSVLKVPIKKIQAFLESLFRVKLSVGEIVNLSHKVGEVLEGEVEQLRAQARGSPYLHMDETGWREDGQNGYIWCMVAETPHPVRYFEYHQSRAGAVVQEMLGEQFEGVVVSDFYSGYNIYTGQHQRCWVHLLRDLSELREAHLTDPEIVAWCVGVKNLYHLAHQMADEATSPPERLDAVARLTEMARQFGLLYAQGDHPCRALAKRLIRHMDELFLFVRYEDLSADNNLAERALRSLVVQRKISGGSRSADGSLTCMRLASLFQTWLARQLNPLHECWRLLGFHPSWAISAEL